MRHVLFLCTGNSARSILAEAVLNRQPAARGRLRAFSAGSHPRGQVHPLALEVLREHDVAVADLRSKSWDEFGQPDAPTLDLVITVCDQAAAEQCPFWPGHPATVHWGLPDPAAVEGTDDEKREAFRRTLHVLNQRVERLVALPVERLDGQALRREVAAIARPG
jgi:protein-tyrosine-phosphatase